MNDPRTRSFVFWLALAGLVTLAAFAYNQRVVRQFRLGAELRTRVDLNAASLDELQAVPWIGPDRAIAIVEHRQAHGPFRSVDDLLAVHGIGPVTLDAVRGFVRVAGDAGDDS